MRLDQVGNLDHRALVEATLNAAKPFEEPSHLTDLVKKIAQAKVVMLGEASHGTHEFYEWRRIISQDLIQNHGFRFIVVEGDWPPAWELNTYIQGGAGNIHQALEHFRRWPTWMWANQETIDLGEWMRDYNGNVTLDKKAGFYGLDVYSLFESMQAAIAQLKPIQPFLAKSIAARFACFDSFGRDEKAYAKSLIQDPEGCLDEVVNNLKAILDHRLQAQQTGAVSSALLSAEQNARIVVNAENYYRTMIRGNEDSWNVRDRHMFETLEMLLAEYGPDAKGIVWAHNTHIGDYRATDMPLYGQINLGGLARERLGEKQVSLVGFGTFAGEVIASHAWDGPIEKMLVPSAKLGSYEAAFHKVTERLGHKSFYLDFSETESNPFIEVRGHRAIGVLYQPKLEAFGNYVPSSLGRRYDAFLFFDQTTALQPLYLDFDRKEIPETWPQGM